MSIPCDVSKAFCETKMILSHCAFTWKIENLSYFTVSEKVNVESPTYRSGPGNIYDWKLSLGVEACRVRILVTSSTNVKYAKVRCSLKNSKNSLLDDLSAFVKSDCLDRPGQNSLLLAPTQNRPYSLLRSDKYFEKFLDDVLVVVFEATVSHSRISTILQSAEIEYTPVPTKFTNHLKELYDNDKFADFGVRVGCRRFAAHRLVLAANSPVLEAMLNLDVKENSSREVEITGFEPGVVQELLRFMYAHSRPEFKTWEFACQLYEISDVYDVADLKEICKEFLVSVLEAKNVADILAVADLHSDEELRQQVLQYIQSNPSISLQSNPNKSIVEQILVTSWSLLKRSVETARQTFFDIPSKSITQ